MVLKFTKAKFILPLLVVSLLFSFKKSEKMAPSRLFRDVSSVFNASDITAKSAAIRPPLSCINPTSNVERIVCLANDFKATLSATQIASVEIAWTTASQAKWSNLPGGSNTAFTLGKTYPNPFTNATTIPFTLNSASNVKVSILDIFGREIAVIAHQKMDAGAQNIVFNRQANNANLAAGSYICKITVTNSSGVFTNSNLLMVQ